MELIYIRYFSFSPIASHTIAESVYNDLKEDQEFSLIGYLEQHFDALKFLMIIIIAILGVPIFITGVIIIYFAELMFGLPLIILALVLTLALSLTMYFLIFTDKKKFIEIQKLKEKEQIQTLLEIVRNKNKDLLDEPKPYFAINALIDLRCEDLLPLLKSQLVETTNPKEVTIYLWFLNLFALKVGYNSIIELLE